MMVCLEKVDSFEIWPISLVSVLDFWGVFQVHSNDLWGLHSDAFHGKERSRP